MLYYFMIVGGDAGRRLPVRPHLRDDPTGHEGGIFTVS